MYLDYNRESVSAMCTEDTDVTEWRRSDGVDLLEIVPVEYFSRGRIEDGVIPTHRRLNQQRLSQISLLSQSKKVKV